jgi:hypothetical protein
MRYIILLFIVLLNGLSVISTAQDVYTDTFIRKDGIHPVPSFTEWEPGTLFALKKTKNKAASGQPVLSVEAAERLKFYSDKYSNQKTEPYRFFLVLDVLALHDSSTYFERVSDMPPMFRSFFRGLYLIENNEFDKAVSAFDSLSNTEDSVLLKEVPFWKIVTKKLLNEHQQHNAVFAAYNIFEREAIVDSSKLFHLLSNVDLPQYMMHKYVNLFNYYHRKKHYDIARSTYDSILAYTTHSKMKASLSKNRESVLEWMESKEKFISAIKNDLYHYEIDYLYDHLETWKRDTLTDKAFSALAGFKLHQQSTTKTDSIFVRRLIDTAANEQLNKFEILSLVRTPIDKAGRRFIMVKLGFANDSTFKKYLSFLSKFKTKPIQQSVLYGTVPEGDEYMLTQFFIAALYQKDDPLIKYELSIYSIEDAEGNSYAVDTLF